MTATIILGIVIAWAFAWGIRHIYRNFFKGETTCCPSTGAACACCAKHKNN